VRPCGGVIEFIDANQTMGEVFNSPSEDIRATCDVVVFDAEKVLTLNSDVEGDDLECIVEMAPTYCDQCRGDCPDLNKYNQEFIKDRVPLLLELEERANRKQIFGDAKYNDGFTLSTKRPT